ncbi:hypothetical protein [Pedobacter sp. D749]|uniref:hypothetical protein n=1 Tax=Pedobacter sp. D749 TaxID=2856523 RepID=UPI001C5A27CB|nr:hypothetical protein [Pedobacter sp. D749]QXU43667.1 hypothetical protein KYH19_08820 [Pedobacter sp. D749]
MKLNNNKFSTVIKALILANTLVSCNSNSQNMQENNKEVDKFNSSELYPNNKVAFTKSGEKTVFYNAANEHLIYAEINHKTNHYQIDDIDLFPVRDLFQINDFTYFLPKKYSTFYKYPIGQSGTAGGDFFTTLEFNELGLIKSIDKNLPDSHRKYTYRYNKFAQLLRVFENKLLNKTLLENKYDENGRLIFQEKNDEELQAKREFIYGKEGRILKENIKEKKIAPNGRIISDLTYTLNYEYNKLGQISKKQSQDSNFVEQFQYDSNGRIVNFVKYYGEIDKDDSNKLINYFIKKIYSYSNEQISSETVYEYHLVNASVLINKNWQLLNIEQQRKMAGEKLNDNNEMPTTEIERLYNYKESGVTINVNHSNFSNRVLEGKSKFKKEVFDSETIKFSFDNSGKIIKKETTGKNGETSVETYSY